MSILLDREEDEMDEDGYLLQDTLGKHILDWIILVYLLVITLMILFYY